jgi:Mg2+/Co2+ transporter CorC
MWMNPHLLLSMIQAAIHSKEILSSLLKLISHFPNKCFESLIKCLRKSDCTNIIAIRTTETFVEVVSDEVEKSHNDIFILHSSLDIKSWINLLLVMINTSLDTHHQKLSRYHNSLAEVMVTIISSVSAGEVKFN